MSTHTVNPIRGSTASSALPPPRPATDSAPHSASASGAIPGDAPAHAAAPPRPRPGAAVRHPVGDALRAAGVFLDTAFRVVVLGTDGTRQPDRQPDRPADRPADRRGDRPGDAPARGIPGQGRR